MKHTITLFITALLGICLLYFSRFWPFNLWSRNSALADFLPPQGNIVARILRQLGGGELAALELIIWAIIGFFALSIAQKIYEHFKFNE